MKIPYHTVIVLGLLILNILKVNAQDYSAYYEARLSAQDHTNSGGSKLSDIPAILRQDRANYHKFKKRDQEDQPDAFFAKAKNRGLMEKYFKNTYSDNPMNGKDLKAILEGTPLVRVSLVNGIKNKKFLSVEVISEKKSRVSPALNIASKIIGTWEYNTSRRTLIYVFKPNGTFSSESISFTGGKERSSKSKGKWSISGNTLMLNGAKSGSIESISDKSFQLKDELFGGNYTRL